VTMPDVPLILAASCCTPAVGCKCAKSHSCAHTRPSGSAHAHGMSQQHKCHRRTTDARLQHVNTTHVCHCFMALTPASHLPPPLLPAKPLVVTAACADQICMTDMQTHEICIPHVESKLG
jgi:hypothetical protein